MRIRRIAVAGVGTVGRVLADYFSAQGYDVQEYDPPKGLTNPDALIADVIFIAVPTPYSNMRSCDLSAVRSVLELLPTDPRIVVIKSTVPPGTTEDLQQQYAPHRLLFNPEFLRAKTAPSDFTSPERQVMGFTSLSYPIAQGVLELLPKAPYQTVVPASVAEMAKLAGNCFLAVKVIFANEIFDVCTKLGVSYEQVRRIISHDSRIGSSHLQIFEDGYRGFGGPCLPKDVDVFIHLCRKAEAPARVMKTARYTNLRLRDTIHAQERS